MQILLGVIEKYSIGHFFKISVNWVWILRQFSETSNHYKGELPVIVLFYTQ